MSEPAEDLSNTYIIRFPPFPAPQEGVEIVPFKDFKETGIRLFNDDPNVELDGHGIPTIELRVRHPTDVCKSNAVRKRKYTGKRGDSSRAIIHTVKQEWWQSWEENEESRRFSYDSYVLRLLCRLSFVEVSFSF
jgi:hypothetical protein